MAELTIINKSKDLPLKRNDQTGFSIAEGLLILVVVGILGFTGWYVYHANQTSGKNYMSTGSTVSTYKKKATTNTTVAANLYAG